MLGIHIGKVLIFVVVVLINIILVLTPPPPFQKKDASLEPSVHSHVITFICIT